MGSDGTGADHALVETQSCLEGSLDVSSPDPQTSVNWGS